MNKTIFFILFCSFSYFSLAQRQISNIDFFVESIPHPNKGFIPIGDDTYFIESGSGPGLTLISKIEGDSLKLIHTISSQPEVDSRRHLTLNTENNSSYLNYDNELLIEVFTTDIFVHNILTGERIDRLNLYEKGIHLFYDFHFTDDHFYFYGLQDTSRLYYQYDRKTKDLRKINFDNNGFPYRIGEYLYNYDWESNSVHQYNMTTDFIDTISIGLSSVNIRRDLYGGKRHLTFIDPHSTGVSLINNHNEYKEIACLDGIKPQSVYFMTDLILYITTENNQNQLNVVQRNNCELVNRFTLDYAYDFTDSRVLFDRFVWLTKTAPSYNRLGQLMYDVARDTLFTISTFNASNRPYQEILYDNTLYYTLGIDIHHVGGYPEIQALNLEDMTISPIHSYPSFDKNVIYLGEAQANNRFYIYFDTDNENVLREFNHQTQRSTVLHEFNYLRNAGLSYNILPSLWEEDIYFFHSRNGLYAMQNDDVGVILDNIEPEGISDYLISDHKLHALVNQDSGVYIFSFDLFSFETERTVLTGIPKGNIIGTTTEDKILHIPYGYYDLEKSEFDFFPTASFNNPFNWRYYKNGDILILNKLVSGTSWHLFNLKTKQFRSLHGINNYDDIFPVKDGGFLIVDGKDIQYLNEDGSLQTLVSNLNLALFDNGSKLDGDVQTLAFDAANEMVLFSYKDGEYEIKRIPDPRLLYYFPFFWKKNNDLSILEVPNDSRYNTYMYRFNEEPINIYSPKQNWRLRDVIFEEDRLVLLYQEGYYDAQLYFVNYDMNTQNIEVKNQLNIAQNYSSHFIEITDHEYLISLHEKRTGMEPWVYNSSTGELELLKDMLPGVGGSHPREYFKSPDGRDIYFTAGIPDQGRQLFKLDKSTSMYEITKIPAPLIINPSPAHQFIQIDKILNELTIFDSNGIRQIYQKNYMAGEQIDISHLPNGTFFIKGIQQNGQLESGKFIIIK